MYMRTEPYGTLPTGEVATLYTMVNDNGMEVRITNFGGVVTHLLVPDKAGKTADVVLGHKGLEEYLDNPGYFGACVGRNANRIAGASISIGDTVYALEKNNGENNLHGGKKGLSFRLFDGELRTLGKISALFLTTKIPHMEDDFPGELSVTVAYALTEDNALMIDYRAVSDKDTIINLTNHCYFNLAGHDSGDVHSHLLELDAPFYNPVRADCVPTGEIFSVKDTPFNFTSPKAIGKEIDCDHPQIRMFGGYDHNFVLAGAGYRQVGKVTDPASGRTMEVFTDLPGVQLYTGNGLPTDKPAKDGAVYGKHQGLCLETQTFPNAAAMPWVVSPLYPSGIEFSSTTAYKFGVL